MLSTHDELVQEKITLAKQLGSIDRRLSEIDRLLMMPQHPDNGLFTINRSYSEPLFFRYRMVEPWVNTHVSETHRFLLSRNTMIWPVRESKNNDVDNKYTVLDSCIWKHTHAFALSDVDVFRFPQFTFYSSSEKQTYQYYHFVSFTALMHEYIGVFVAYDISIPPMDMLVKWE